MAEDVMVVEIEAVVKVTNYRGKMVDVGPGVFIVSRDLIAPALRALPERRIRVLDRAPTEEEIQASTEAGLIAPAEVDDRPLDDFSKQELVDAAELLDLPTSGTKAELIARIDEAAEAAQVDPDQPGRALVDAIATAQQPDDSDD